MTAKTINMATARVYYRGGAHTPTLKMATKQKKQAKPNNNQKQYRMCQTIHMVIVYSPSPSILQCHFITPLCICVRVRVPLSDDFTLTPTRLRDENPIKAALSANRRFVAECCHL